MPMPIRSTSAGSTPTHTPQDCLAGVGGDVLEAFAQGVPRNLRNDLLVAADSITNTMSSLVKELHSVDDGAEEDETNMRNGGDRGGSRHSESSKALRGRDHYPSLQGHPVISWEDSTSAGSPWD
ncbi:hypothetical protein AMECASPLE_024191 [Ameca splendens]|uniref:Uncharacterized protein n=3 Tax=Goodeidae TaxID=28758 RepID=A0ABV0ZRC0_9TELE